VPPRLCDVFQALADPTRLAIVERLGIGPASTTELAQPFSMALPSFIQHLGVLASAGVITSQKSGRVRTFQLSPDGLAGATDWLTANRNHWIRRLDQLDALLLDEVATDGPSNHPTEPTPKEHR
jgi:DNA-binding transcriptional ArsR family regulator